MRIQFFALVFSFFALTAQNHPDQETGKYVKNTRQNWNFELYNKSSDTIWFSIYFPGWVFNQKFISYQKISAGEKMRLVIKLEDNPILRIWRKENPLYFGGMRERAATLERQLEPCIGHHAKFIGIQCSRTAFLTFDENNVLRPQTGPLEGFSTTTESGLNRLRNINISGIRQTTKAIR